MTGLAAIRHPPACKAGNIDGLSMEYDPFDYESQGYVT